MKGFTLPGVLTALSVALGCAPDFTPGSEVRKLRILGVQKDKPYARPGDTIELGMLLADGSGSAPRPIQVLWIAGCENPPGDLYAACFADLEGVTPPENLKVGEGASFSFQLSDDIITRRPIPADPDQPPYGLAYVFFAACAGEVRFSPDAPSGEFPIGCFSPSGRRLGTDDFVAGYTAVFAYDGFTNDNPEITGFSFDGREVAAECIDDECVALETGSADPDAGGSPRGDAGDAGGDAEARPAGGAGPTGALAPNPCISGGVGCVATCRGERSECEEHDITVVVPPSSAQIDTVTEARTGRRQTEQMWINYYIEGGTLETEVKLLNDATAGFNEDHGTTLKAPSEPGPFLVWAVVHDSRGGAAFARLRLGSR